MAKSRNWGRSANDVNMGERRVGEQAPKERELHHEWGAKLRRAGRVAVTSALIYVFFSSSALAPFGMAISRAYATGEPLVNLTDSPAPETETEGDGQGDTPQEPGQNGAAPQEGNAGNSSDPDNDANPGSVNDPANDPAGEEKDGEDPKTEDPSGDQDGAATPDTDDNKKQDSTQEDDPSSADASKKDADDKAGQQADAPAAAPTAGDSVTGGASQDDSADGGGESDDDQTEDDSTPEDGADVAKGAEYLPPDTANPNGTIDKDKIYPKLMVSNADAVPGNKHTYLVRKGNEPDMLVDFDLGSTSALFGQGPRRLLTLTLQIPYLINDENNPDLVIPTLDKERWLAQNNGNDDGMRLSIVPSLTGSWQYYHKNGAKITPEEAGKGISGEIIAQYVGNQGSFKNGADLPTQKVIFKGAVPENTAADIRVGLQCTYFEDGDTKINGNLLIDPTLNTDERPSSPRRITFINTNLEWEQRLESIHEPVLWDRYNYMVYEVTVENTSKSPDAKINHFALNLEPEAGLTNNKHILQKDIATWEINDAGEVVPHAGNHGPNDQDRDCRLVGKPGEGGVLIYDVSDVSQEVLDELDLDRFSNAANLGLQPMEYKSLMDGYVNLEVDQELYNPEGDELAPEDHRTYYIAFPYTTNMFGTGGEQPFVNQSSIATIYFGRNAEYGWSAENQVTSQFQAPKVSFSQTKRVRNLENGNLSSTAPGYVGWLGTYVIEGLTTKGSNIPVYGPESDDPKVSASGPRVLDTLPDDFSLRSVELQTKTPEVKEIPPRELAQYFDMEHGPLEVEIDDTWHKLDIAANEGAEENLGSSSAYRTWVIGPEGDAYEGSIEQAIDALEKEEGGKFTGRIRISLVDELPADKDIPVRIKINGVLDAPQSEFANNVVTEYGQRYWSATSRDPDGHYVVTKRESEKSKASYTPVSDVVPGVNAVAHGVLPSNGQLVEGELVTLPLGLADAGWRFELTNTSKSKMQPAKLSTSAMDASYSIDHLRISKALLDNSVIERIEFSHWNGAATDVLTGEDLYELISANKGNVTIDEATGDVVIKSGAWGGSLLGISIYFDSFNNGIDGRSGAFIDITGRSTMVKDYSLAAMFETEYSEKFESEDKLASDSATVRTRPSVPQVSAIGHTWVEGDEAETSGSNIDIPLSAGVSGWRFKLQNMSDTKMEPARFKTSDLAFTSIGGKEYGFVIDDVTLSAGLLDASDIEKVELWLLGEQQPVVVSAEDLKGVAVEENGDKRLSRDKFWKDKLLVRVEIAFKSVSGDVYDSDNAFVDLTGQSNHVKRSFTLQGTFGTDYPPEFGSAQTFDSDSATLNTESANPAISAQAHGDNDSSGATVDATLGAEGAGWKYILTNNSRSGVAPARFATDVLEHDALLGKEYGFEIDHVMLSEALLRMTEIEEMRVFHTGSNDPVVLSGEDIAGLKTESDGSVHVGRAGRWDGELATKVEIDFASVRENITGTDAFIDLVGAPTKVADFPLRAEFGTDYGPDFKNEEVTRAASATIHVIPATVELHTHGKYVDVAEAVRRGSEDYPLSTTDQTITQIAVPYDRDFDLWVEIGNKTAAPLCDVDVSIQVPLAWETGIKQEDGSTLEAWTGFHTTGLTFSSELLAAWEKYGEIHLYDADTMKSQGSPDVVLMPKGDGSFATEDGKLSFAVNADGDLVITEDDLKGYIANLKNVDLVGWKGLEPGSNTSVQTVAFEGFSDSMFNGTSTLYVMAENFFTGVRPEGARNPLHTVTSGPVVDKAVENALVQAALAAASVANEPWSLQSNDYTWIYVSKMFFDASARAAYFDGNPGDAGARFTDASTPNDTGHSRDTSDAYNHQYAAGYNNSLETGYKSIGSYLFDFRQYIQAYNQSTDDSAMPEPYYKMSNEYRTLLSGKTYNTGAELRVTQDLPESAFDAYYLKVRPEAVGYLKEITVNYTDGTSKTTTADEWQNTANAQESVDGTKYFRIDIMDGKLGFDGGDTAPKRDAINDYGDDDYIDGELRHKRVVSIVYTLRINQEQYGNAEQTVAKMVDFGTGYSPTDEGSTANIEVTGRFFGDPSKAVTSSSAVDMHIGGDYSGKIRSGAKAVVRYQDAEDDSDDEKRSSWSYVDYTNRSLSSNREKFKAGHIVSQAYVWLDRDEQYVLKGVHDNPKLDYVQYKDQVEGATNVRFGSDQRFSMTYYRMNTSSNDWGTGRVSFSDHTRLTDDLPVIEQDGDTYYGFLSTGLRVGGNNPAEPDVIEHLEGIEFKIKSLTSASIRTVRVPRGDLEKYIDKTSGEFYVDVAPEGQSRAPELAGKNAYRLQVGANEALQSYTIELSAMGGDADSSRELAMQYDAERSYNKSDIDSQVYGRPYAYAGQRGSAQTIRDCLNTFSATSSLSFAPNTFTQSAVNSHTTGYPNYYYVLDDHARDQAYFLGYLIPFQTRATLSRAEGSEQYLFDYASDNNTPNTSAVEVRYQNRPDSGADDGSRSSRVSKTTLRVDMSTGSADTDMFHARNVYIPKEFVPLSLGGTAAWFKVANVNILTGTNKSQTLSLEALRDNGWLSEQPNEKGLFVLDVEKMLRDDANAQAPVGLVGTYQGLNSTNTLSSDFKNSEWDQTYANPHVKQIAVTFEAMLPDLENPETVLAGGQYLSPDKTDKGFAFSYDGIYIDRTQEDFKAAKDQEDLWSETSTPTFGKSGNAMGQDVQNHHAVYIENVQSVDPNHQSHSIFSGTGTPTLDFYVSNLVGRADVNVARGKKVELNGVADATVFAYDRDENSMTATESYDPASTDDNARGNNIPNGMVMPGDYIDYTITIDAVDDKDMRHGDALPLEHTQGRFEAPEGQRIIGWEILENTTGIPNEQITAQFEEAGDEDANGTPNELRPAEPQTDYSLTADGEESYVYNRNLVVSVGVLDEDDPDDVQIQPGKGVKLRVITQMTDELQNDRDAYRAEENKAFEDDKPSYENETLEAHFKVMTRPKHGYVQQRFMNDSYSLGSSPNGNSRLTYTYDTDVDTTTTVNDNRVDYYGVLNACPYSDGKRQLGLDVRSMVRFYDHADKNGADIDVKAEFTDDYDNGDDEQNDGSAADVTVSGIENPTRHTQDMTVTVDFTEKSGSGANERTHQVFQLSEAPGILNAETGKLDTLTYPEHMPANEVSPRKKVLIEYYDTSHKNDDGSLGAWVIEDELVSQKLPSSGEEAEGIDRENRGEGAIGALVDFFAADKLDPVGPSEGIRATESKFHMVTAVRWTYFDVPATTNGTAQFVFDNVTLRGVGRYADIRPDDANTEMADSFTGDIRVDLGLTHTHDENTAIDFETPSKKQDHDPYIVKYDEGSKTELTVFRSAPTFTFQTQTFQTAEQAAAPWNSQAEQKMGYVPGEAFWYKDSLTNMAGGSNPAAPQLEGETYNPVIYERIPSKYLTNEDGTSFTLDESKVAFAWYDREGNDIATQYDVHVERVDDAKRGVESGEAPDFGGSMNYDSDVTADMTVGGARSKGVFSDMNPSADGVTNSTSFDLYRVYFTNKNSADGEPTIMRPGERIEVWYQVKAAVDGLPQVYLDVDDNLATSADQSPAYFPRIGEYQTTTSGDSYYVNPLNSASGDGFGPNRSYGAPADSPIRVNNGNVLMDMDALLHDAAFTADRPEQSDLWEAFDASRSYIPGSSVTSESWTAYGASGQNDVYLDEDMKTGKYQQVQYVPRKASSSSLSEARYQLPGETYLVTPNSTQGNGSQNVSYHRDYAQFVTNPRTQGDKQNLECRWASKTPLVWSESSLHLQKAWLAAASDMEPNTGDYKAERQYEPSDYKPTATYDPHYLPWSDALSTTSIDDRVRESDGVVLNKYAAALQYNQDFTARLQAFNYGDRNLDGVEMLYVMPRGVEPKLPDGMAPADGQVLSFDQLGATAEILTRVDGTSGAGSDAQVSEAYQDITQFLTVEVVQSPYGADHGYRAPSDPQDPGYYRDGAELTEDATDLSADPGASSYESDASGSNDRSTEEYAQSSQPWVLRVRVTHPLAKWFGRSIDATEANTADPDGWVDGSGYKLRVNVPAHVFSNNASGTWNDRLLVTPWDDPASTAPSKASSYFSVMDVDHYEGMNAVAANMNDMQVYGMDFMWALYYTSTATTWNQWELLASSPNMPSVNGYSVLNNSVLASDGNAGKVQDRNTVRYDTASKAGGTLWAQTGTRAVMRKPYVRTWNTVGANGVTGPLDEYYLDTEFDSVQMNVHVENRHWWDDYAIQYDTYGGSQSRRYEPAVHNYAVDGGAKGDLVLPVVTTVLPEGIAPIDSKGRPYPTDGKPHALDNWGLTMGAAEDYQRSADVFVSNNEGAMDRFDAMATYEEVAKGEGGEPVYRFVVRFIAKDPERWNAADGNTAWAPDANTESRIPSGLMDIFKFNVATVATPAYDKNHPETAQSYENAYTYVSSKMPGAQILTDNDVPNNPYKVGSDGQAERVWRYSGAGASDDARLDAVQYTYVYGGVERQTKGVVPLNIIDDGADTVLGVQENRLPGTTYEYYEQDKTRATPDVANYTFRHPLKLNVDVAEGLNGIPNVMYADPFARSNGVEDATLDKGAMTAFKLRVAKPRLVADHVVEFDPSQDIPTVDGDDHVREPGMPEAGEGELVTRDPAGTGELGDTDEDKVVPLQYGDTPWYRATLSNDPGEGDDLKLENTGAVLHGKLVFAVHLPKQVSFYNKEQMTDNNFTSEDAGSFYLEWTHFDRATGEFVTDLLAPKDLVDNGWFVHVREVPNWGANDFSQPDYAKPDRDDPNDVADDADAKPKDREGETLVFEFAAPHDATDEEFDTYETLADATRAGVRPDGYFGSGDSLSLRVKTRVDNVGPEGDLLDSENHEHDDPDAESASAPDSNGSKLTTAWLAEASEFYATVHDLDGRDWNGDEAPDDAWISAWRSPSPGKPDKPVFGSNPNNIFDQAFSEQRIETFVFENRVEDEPERTEVALDLPPVQTVPAVDYDLDGDFTDIYTSATSGAFKIAKPKSSVRIDTQQNRVLVTNPDLGDEAADDASLGAEQILLLDQAVNAGAAVNSMIVDWDIPYHATEESSLNHPDLDGPLFNSMISEISTGVWEIPGSRVADDASEEALALAEYEKNLRVFMLVRVEPLDKIADDVEYYRPGTSDDRDAYDSGTWRMVGSQTGYPVREQDGSKANNSIMVYNTDTPGYLESTEAIKEIRWVIKAYDAALGVQGMEALLDDDASQRMPIPSGFRLDVDAVPDDERFDVTHGDQEMDDIDPNRMNTGWELQVDPETGELVLDDAGRPKIMHKTPMPDTVTENAARVKAMATTTKTLHVNHFAHLSSRYDDTKFMGSDEARAGYFRDQEYPYLAIEMDQYYFNGGPMSKYEWVKGMPTLDLEVSRMMKYRITLKNLSTEWLKEHGRTGEGDFCTNPDISAMLPFISALPTSGKDFTYVPHEKVLSDPSCYLRDDYATYAKQNESGAVIEYAANLNEQKPMWTYYITGEDVGNTPFPPRLESTEVGTDSVRLKQQPGPDLTHNRQYLSMHFTGDKSFEGVPQGMLSPGQDLVVEFMMPIREDASGVTAGSLMDAAGFVHKTGNYSPYIPEKQDRNNLASFVSDTRDSNLDGSTSQLMIMRNLSGMTFKDSEAFHDIKSATTQLDTLFTKVTHGPASAPEGTEYTYSVQTSNLNSDDNKSINYIYPVIYDILPFENDYEASNRDSGSGSKPRPRNSRWNGWLTSLGESDGASPAIEVVVNNPKTSDEFPDGRPLDPGQYTLWVGPFRKEADGAITAQPMDALAKMYQVPKEIMEQWVRIRRDNENDVMHAEGFVTLEELQEFVKEHPEQEEAMRKHVRAIWCTVSDQMVHIPSLGSIELRYHLRVPQNLPKYLGDTSKTAATDEDKKQPLYQRLMDTAQWNTFFHLVNRDGTKDSLANWGELTQAGVVVDAPDSRGYIGDYVWLDANWSKTADDTVNGASDYETSKNGRKLLSGVRKDGSAFNASTKLKDLDGDGVVDDPGINGVTVELLNEFGRPVNRDGKVTQFAPGVGAEGQDAWLECDPETGELITDPYGSHVVAEAGGPFSFTTESDYYGNAGYYILSNLATKDDEGKQLKYRLRFTFPERYANYAVTTTEMGDGVKVEFETVAGDDGTERLVATTGNITPTPVKYDKDKFANGQPDPVHAAYDAAAVSHDLGIALPVTYEGVVYRDDLLEDGNASDPIDGYLDRQSDPSGADPNKTELPEQRLANTTVSVHEFDVATQQMNPKPALDAYGQPATMTTDASGAFSFTLKPHRTYVLVSSVEGAIVKPTPYLWNPGPTDAPDDNDLYSLHGTTLTRPFAALPPVGADGAPSYVAPGDPSSGYTTQKVFALGYVDATLAFIGDTVWEDVNHDGIQQTDEPGISGVTVTLEQYWWDESANGGKGAWKLYEPEPTQTLTTNAAGTYVFKVKTALPKPGDPDDPDAPAEHALAGYRLRIDRDDLEKLGFPLVATHQNVGKDDELDSDVSRSYSDAATGADATGSAPRTQYLTPEDGQIVVANEFVDGESAAGQQAAGPDGKTYDLGSGKTVHDVDAGYVRVKTSAITGTVWADADRDGLQDTAGDNPAEEGMADQQVVLEQYYLDGKTWVRNDAFGADAYTTGIVTGGTVDQADPGKVTVTTDATGAYRFDNLPIAYMAPGSEQPKLAGYRLTLGGLAADHTLARYHASMDDDPAFDTTRIDSDVYDVDLAIVDRESFDAKDNDAGSRPNDGQVILAAKAPSGASLAGATDPATKIAYDALEVDATELDDAGAPFKRGGDVGEVPLANASVSGLLWQDLDNDGIQDADAVWVDANDNGRTDDGEMLPEAGVPGIEVALTRYLANPDAPDGWEPDPTFGTDGRMTAVTDDQGEYRFDKLEGAQYDAATGKATVYAYRVELADHEAVSSSWHIARYQQGDDRAVDSDLMVDTGSMVDTDASEYLVLLEPATDETAQTNQAKAPASLPEDGQGLVTYDVTALVSNDTHDGGLLPRATRSIAGYLWHDADYDGLRDADELGLAQKEVTLHRWIYRDGAWEPFDMAPVVDPDEEIDPDFGVDPDAGAGDDPADPDVDPGMGFDPNDPAQIEPSEASVLTDDTGRFVFENEPVAVRVDGEEHLMGYTLTALGTDVESDVNHGVAGLPVTAVQVDSPAADAANSKARRPEVSGGDVEIAWDEKDSATEDRRTLDGRLVLATPKRDDSHEAYVVGDFDLSTGRGELRMNAGFGPFPTSSLTGIVWDDAHYDGLQQLEDPENPEHGMADVTVRITQWYQNEEGEFVQNEDFGDAENFALEAVTDEEGTYRFDDLPTYVQMATDPQTGDKRPARPEERGDDDFRLAAYRVSLVDMPESYAVTRYHVGDDHRIDSDLRSDVAAKDLDIVEVYADETPEGTVLRGDGFAILAEPVANGGEPAYRSAYPSAYNDVTYDTLRALGVQRGGDAGLVRVDPEAAIEGLVWEDADGNGERALTERRIAGATVTLTRYMRVVGGTGDGWLFDDEFETLKVETKADGKYRFDGLASSAYRTIDNAMTRVLYGYRVNVTDIPEGYAVTKLNQGEDATRDSDLDMGTTRVLPDEALGGLTVLANEWQSDEDVAMKLDMGKLGTFTAAMSHDVAHLDAGLVPQDTTRVAGLVWEDANKDGLQTAGEYLRVGQKVMLDRRVMTKAELDAAGFGTTVADGAPGSSLDSEGEPLVAATPMPPELPWMDLEPAEPVEPEGGEPVDPEAPEEGGDPGEGDEPVVPEAPEGDGSTDGEQPGTDEQGGQTDPDDGSAEEPQDGDGAGDDAGTESALAKAAPAEGSTDEDDTQDLPRLEDDGILSDGDWEEIETTLTDLTGHYVFEDLPVADDEGRPYVYRVRMIKPDGAEYVPLNVDDGSETPDAFDNDYAHLNVLGALTPEEIGVTETLASVSAYEGGANAYGQPWDVSSGVAYSRDLGNSVDLGIFIPAPEPPAPGPEPDTPKPPVVDPDPDTPEPPAPTPVEPDPDEPGTVPPAPKPGIVDTILDALLPQTGDEFRLVRVIALGTAGIGLIAVALVLSKRRRKE